MFCIAQHACSQTLELAMCVSNTLEIISQQPASDSLIRFLSLLEAMFCIAQHACSQTLELAM
ncbi:MAG: hypothetical protein ACK56F_05970, partial [bacterium]